MYFVTLIFVALFICQHIGAEKPSHDLASRIVNGSIVEITKHPYMALVRLSYKNGTYNTCGGSIIGKRWILTAAYCVKSKHVKSVNVRVGSADASKGGTSVKVSETIIHKDIALLKLDQDLKWSSSVKCINLYSEKEPKPGTDCTLSGWGEYKRGQMSDKLRSVKMPILERNKCKKLLRSTVLATKKMICAGYDKKWKGGCKGDAGGPLVCKNKLVGLYSWKFGECGERPGVFTNVASYQKWISKKTSINPKKCES